MASQEQLEAALRRVEAAAEAARPALDAPLSTMGLNVWLGGTADEFAAELTHNRQDLARALDRCLERVTSLKARAQHDAVVRRP
jgi:alkanesulfonate monooxygenase SsuD/methylene tetrahydromethanopterin reductase-like flavin-dependent oxidoreductase (luciferase family)